MSDEKFREPFLLYLPASAVLATNLSGAVPAGLAGSKSRVEHKRRATKPDPKLRMQNPSSQNTGYQV